MADINAYDNNGATNGNDIRRPKEVYDDIIRFIEAFPLRLVVALVGLSLLMQLAHARDSMTGMDILYATLGYIVGFFVLLGEIACGKVTRLIKDLLIRAVMMAEQNAAEL